jgi:hypothetical protein
MEIEAIFRLESLVAISLVLKATGFLVRDELILRVLVTVGIICDVLFYALQTVPIIPPIISSMVLIVINVSILVVLALERTTLAMSDREKRLFAAFETLTPGQFRKLMRMGSLKTASEQTVILEEGVVPERVFHIEGARYIIGKSGFQAEVEGPAFAGEIAYLTGRGASATVTLPSGTDYVEWLVKDLRRASRRNQSLRNALIARFSLDMARKMTNSVPTGALADVLQG